MFACLVLINLIQFNVLHKINFELQHPLFMVIMAFATVITGGILRYKLVTIGGIIFGLIALLSSYVTLPYQLLLESFAWLIAFVIPGHYLYATRKS
jgi:branched-subunit amino acid ABC-type transport system permease component